MRYVHFFASLAALLAAVVVAMAAGLGLVDVVVGVVGFVCLMILGVMFSAACDLAEADAGCDTPGRYIRR